VPSRRSRDEGEELRREPALRGARGVPAPANEVGAEPALGGEAGAAKPDDLATHSVHDEPSTPGAGGTIVRSWSCEHCGYNLRGLGTGHPCPECGLISVHHPPIAGAEGFGSWLAERMSRPRPWWVVPLLILGAVPLAVLAPLVGMNATGGGAGAFLGAPFEEIMKIALIATVVHTRPYLIRHRGEIMVAAVLTAFIYATIENAWTLFILLPSPTPLELGWRLSVCTAVHVFASAVAAAPLATRWQTMVDEGRRPLEIDELGGRRGSRVVAAIAIHGLYDLGAFLAGYPELMA